MDMQAPYYTRLAESGAVSERQGRQAVATADQEVAAVAASKRRVEALRGALTTAKANLANVYAPRKPRRCRNRLHSSRRKSSVPQQAPLRPVPSLLKHRRTSRI